MKKGGRMSKTWYLWNKHPLYLEFKYIPLSSSRSLQSCLVYHRTISTLRIGFQYYQGYICLFLFFYHTLGFEVFDLKLNFFFLLWRININCSKPRSGSGLGCIFHIPRNVGLVPMFENCHKPRINCPRKTSIWVISCARSIYSHTKSRVHCPVSRIFRWGSSFYRVLNCKSSWSGFRGVSLSDSFPPSAPWTLSFVLGIMCKTNKPKVGVL